MESYFTQSSFKFLSDLSTNNNKQWFDDNRQQYEDVIREPALKFINDIADELVNISPHIRAVSKKVGGSLMRIHRDIRFGKDKRPYKTNIGIQFRHEMGKDVHAPGFYLHIEPGESFIGAGIWRPDATALGKIRDAIIEKSETWQTVCCDKGFIRKYNFSGESLTNPPRGYAKDHPLIDDLKRKDFIAISELSDKTVTSVNMMDQVIERFKIASPYVEYLCHALELRY